MLRTPVRGLLLFLAIFPAVAVAQDSVGCTMPQPPFSVHRANIFSEQQEQWLGEAQADRQEPLYMLLPQDKSEYLTKVGEKLLAQLPATSLHYSFQVFESGQIRSFSFAGGEIYVSRKLVMDAHSEDELAGALAHEIGRVYIHHTASVLTLRLNKMMGVKSLEGKADVDDKYQRLLNLPREWLREKWNAELTEQDQEHDELLADRVGLYAMVKAGYEPEAFVAFLDRVFMNGGFTGNLFTDLFDATPEVSLRIRVAKKLISSLPHGCRITRRQYHSGFQAFQQDLGQERVNPLLPPTPGLKAMVLKSPMSPALENVRLSPDAEYILAQDEVQIHVLSRSPLKVLFSIDAPGAQMAQFTPESTRVVFYYKGLRVENWDIATEQPVGIFDFSDYIGCLQDSLSPDGTTFACFSRNGDANWLRLSDVKTGQLIYQDMNFYHPDYPNVDEDIAARAAHEARQAAVAWSQDGRHFVASSGTSAVGIDLQTGKTVKLGGALSDLYESRLAFVDSDKLVFECDWGYKIGTPLDTFKMCYTSFPSGNPIHTFTLGRVWMSSTTQGQNVVVGPSADAAATLLDPATGKTGDHFGLETIDLVGETVARELQPGGIATGLLGGAMRSIALPMTPLPSLEAGAFSADGRYLAISDRARGSLWDLSTGERVYLTGPFRNASFDGEDKLQARVASHELKPSANIRIDRRTGRVAPTLSIATETVQYRSVLVRSKPMEKDATMSFNVNITGNDAATGNALWSRHFAEDPPAVAATGDDQLLFLMDRRSQTGEDEVAHNRKLKIRTSDEIKELNERGLMVEVVSDRTGAPQRMVVAPETGAGQGDGRTAFLYGDMLAIQGNSNNTVVYRLSDGERRMAFFGRAIAGDAGLGMIAACNRPQEVTVYDVATRRQVLHVILDNTVLAARMIAAKRQLLVLTSTQRVYALDLPAVATGPELTKDPSVQ